MASNYSFHLSSMEYILLVLLAVILIAFEHFTKSLELLVNFVYVLSSCNAGILLF